MNWLFVILIFLAAWFGGILFALFGWLQSEEPFVPRKFIASVLRSLFGAVGVAIAFDYTGTTSPLAYFIAFAAGLGADEGIKRVGGVAQVVWSRMTTPTP